MKNLYKKLNFYQKTNIILLAEKNRLLLEKDAAYLCDIDYLTLESTWYIKENNNAYRFQLWPDTIHQYS